MLEQNTDERTVNFARDFGPRLMSFFVSFEDGKASACQSNQLHSWVTAMKFGVLVVTTSGFQWWLPSSDALSGKSSGFDNIVFVVFGLTKSCSGFLYDFLLFAGESPLNSPYLGLLGRKKEDDYKGNHNSSAV